MRPAEAFAVRTAWAVLGLALLGPARVEADSPVAFARREIARAAAAVHVPAPPTAFVLKPGLGAQGYRIERNRGGAFTIEGGDAAGAMYGGLDLAEAVRIGAAERISEAVHQPSIRRRGIKFNLPLDLRTPSYSDNGDSFQANIPEVWRLSFWHAFLDEMARDRFNVLSLWNLHPFPSLVRACEPGRSHAGRATPGRGAGWKLLHPRQRPGRVRRGRGPRPLPPGTAGWRGGLARRRGRPTAAALHPPLDRNLANVPYFVVPHPPA